MDPISIIQKYYKLGSRPYNFLVVHSKIVMEKSLEIAKKNEDKSPDLKFIEEAAMLHDIGIFEVSAPEIGCIGKRPYVCHGYLGRKILEKENLPRHALVCERHVGAGISKKDIEEEHLPLPKRDMLPVSIEEQIICFADKFYSKIEDALPKEKLVEEIIKELSKYGEEKVERFNNWLNFFNYKF